VAVLASSLPVALARDGGHATAGFAELARGEPEVDGGEHVVDAFGLLLNPPGVQHHAGRGGAPNLRRLLDPSGRDATDAGRPGGGHVGHRGGSEVEIDGVVIDELVVEPVVTDQLVQDRAE